MNTPKRILLGQLGANGDCLYATTVARQIKTDYPGCHLTWAIGPKWRSVIENNPDVDEIWEVDYYTTLGDFSQWKRFEAEAGQRQQRGEFDEIFLTQITMPNFHLWTSGVRTAIFRAYPHPITVDQSPIVRLRASEVENVRQFAHIHRLAEKSQVVLFECAPRSRQSQVSPAFALEIARAIVAKHPTVAFVLSSNHAFDSTDENIIDGSALTLRENAELTKYCSLLVGASSGITWIATSDWAKPLPMIQLVVPDLVQANSPMADFQQRKADTSLLIEMCDYSKDKVVDCIEEVFSKSFYDAKLSFDQITPLGFFVYRDLLDNMLSRRQVNQCLKLIGLNLREHGFRIRFISIWLSVLLGHFLLLRHKILPDRTTGGN